MSRLAAALADLCRDLTVDELAEAAGLSRTTAGRWLKALRENADISAWTAEAVERLAAWEDRRWQSARLSDALRPVPADTPAVGDPRDQAQRLQHQMLVASRRSNSLALRLGSLAERRQLGRQELRVVLEKADAALQETGNQQSLLRDLRDALRDQLRPGGPGKA